MSIKVQASIYMDLDTVEECENSLEHLVANNIYRIFLIAIEDML